MNVDQKRTIGIVLITLIIILYFQEIYEKPDKRILETEKVTQTITPQSQAKSLLELPSITNKECNEVAPEIEGVEEEITLENNVMKVSFAKKGGMIKRVMLKRYNTSLGNPLLLVDEKNTQMGIQFTISGGQSLQTRNLIFNPLQETESQQILSLQENSLILQAKIEEDVFLEHIFILTGVDDYVIDYTFRLKDLSQTKKDLVIEPQFFLNHLTKNIEYNQEDEKRTTYLNYLLANESFYSLQEKKKECNQIQFKDPLGWVSYKQKFFSVGVLSKQNPFVNNTLSIQDIANLADYNKCLKANFTLKNKKEIDATFSQHTSSLQFYFGPNDYHILKKTAKHFDKNLYLGWRFVRPINQYFILPLFYFFKNYISNVGLLIIVLVLFIKLLLFPLSYKSYIGMAKMKLLQPELEKIKKKYSHNPTTAQMKQMEFYRSMGVNPLSGCIPILCQIPILLALFNFFPNIIFIRQKSFLWAHDLSTYDSIYTLPFTIPYYGNHVSLFTILMTCSTLLYTWSNNQLSPGTMQQHMRVMSYVMSLTFMFILNNFPSALSLYYFLANLLTFLQQYCIKNMVNEKDLKKQPQKEDQKNNPYYSRQQKRLREKSKRD